MFQVIMSEDSIPPLPPKMPTLQELSEGMPMPPKIGSPDNGLLKLVITVPPFGQ